MKLEAHFSGMEDYALFRDCIGLLLHKAVPHCSMMMEIAINEAVNNAIYHGSESMKYKKRVSLTIILKAKRLIVRVKDAGKGFHVHSAGPHSIYRINLLAESGRGLFIISEVADVVKYSKIGNEILFAKKIPGVYSKQ